MTRDDHSECRDLRFTVPLALQDGARVALEDYARVLTRAESAEVLVDADFVCGVHVCRPSVPPPPPVLRDLEAFAEELARRGERGGGLGWT
jgi:hypothetical protein